MYTFSDTTAWVSAGEYIARYRDTGKFIAFCRRCNRYGACWSCPPFSFDPGEYLSGYDSVLIIGTKIIPDKTLYENTDAENHKTAGREIIYRERLKLDPCLLALERQDPSGKAFYAGTCHLCPEGACTRPSGNPCLHPGQIRPSLEACGFDIGRTASDLLHIDLKWSEDGRLPEYFTLVSGFFTKLPPGKIAWMRE